ncbi:MAG: hypothetical protein IJ433_03570 [Ruminococcus sp.]|nr:hypothetical protein [Ruminococcus sp.]
MKRIATVMVATLVLVFCSFSTCAENAKNVEIVLSCDGAVTDRLFDVSVVSDEIDQIVGGEFTLCYDSSVLDFRKASSESFEVKTKTYDDLVKIVFVIDEANHSGNKLFDVQFKAKSKSLTNIELVNSYVVDRNLSVVPIGGVCDILVNSKQQQQEDVSQSKTEVVTVSNDSATADNQSIKINGCNRLNLTKYIGAGALVVLAVGVNVWFVLRKKTQK